MVGCVAADTGTDGWLTSVVDDVPAVEMLWESADPGQELTKRFGLRDGASTAAWVADVLDRYWQLDVVRCDRLVISGRNVMAWVDAGDRPLIVKWSSLPRRFSRLEDAARLVAWLDAEAVPVAAPIAASDGRLLVEIGNDARGKLRSRMPLPGSRFLVGVLPMVEGDLLSVDDPGHVDEAGRLLAILHQALADYPGQVDGGGRGRKQLVHNDFRSANVLHDGTRISAVLDFEEITYETRAADIAKAAVLLATRYRDWGPTSESVRAAFLSAYNGQARDPLATSEQREIDERVATHLKTFGWT
jgi:homoserine kinase type II